MLFSVEKRQRECSGYQRHVKLYVLHEQCDAIYQLSFSTSIPKKEFRGYRRTLQGITYKFTTMAPRWTEVVEFFRNLLKYPGLYGNYYNE